MWRKETIQTAHIASYLMDHGSGAACMSNSLRVLMLKFKMMFIFWMLENIFALYAILQQERKLLRFLLAVTKLDNIVNTLIRNYRGDIERAMCRERMRVWKDDDGCFTVANQ